MARYFASPAPMSAPSSTNTTPHTGCAMASTMSAGCTSAAMPGSPVNSSPITPDSAPISAPVITPNQAPHATVRPSTRRTSPVCSAPRPLPMSAWAAIASASSANAAVEKIVNATCQPASSTVPRPVATATVASRAIRSETVRRNSHPPDRAEPRTPSRCGRMDASCRRARRPTTTAYAATMPHWATTVPIAEPAMPQPNP